MFFLFFVLLVVRYYLGREDVGQWGGCFLGVVKLVLDFGFCLLKGRFGCIKCILNRRYLLCFCTEMRDLCKYVPGERELCLRKFSF